MARAVMKRRTAACFRKRITRGVFRPRKINEPELVHIGPRGIEDGEQRQRVFAHRGLDQNWLAQLGFPQLGLDLGGGLIDAAATASATQRGGDPAHRQFGCGGRCGRNRQHGTRLRAGDPQRESAREDRQEGRVELAQQRPQLMVRGGAPPDRVLVCTGQHRDGLHNSLSAWEPAVGSIRLAERN
jgi:hypothetical protein